MTVPKPGHVRVFVAAGSNVEPEKNLARACAEIAHTWPDALSRAPTAMSRWASRDRTSSISSPGFSTAQPLDAVIARLHAIETQCGRPRYAPKWASRTMDLDVLLYGDRVEKTAEYTLPRPDLLKRPYMLGPHGRDRAGCGASDRAARPSASCGGSSIATAHAMTPVRSTCQQRSGCTTRRRCGRRPPPGSVP